jgi:hypothetical protein
VADVDSRPCHPSPSGFSTPSRPTMTVR